MVIRRVGGDPQGFDYVLRGVETYDESCTRS